MSKSTTTTEFKRWLAELKTRIHQSQIKAAIRVNSELLLLYWDLGRDIVVRQMETNWGSGFFEQLSKELRTEFPNMKGFSERNLYNMKQFYLFYSQDNTILQQVVAKLENPIFHQLGGKLQQDENKEITIRHQIGNEFTTHQIFQIPWGHHVQIITKCKSVKEAMFYVQKTVKNGWSRAMLMNFMETDLYHAQGKALNNFERFLPDYQSDLAKETLKDPYNFDFLMLTEDYKERELEDALVENITKFLLELGQGFAYVGKQYPIKIGKRERFIDLLFYHLELRCFVVIELKTKEFEAEHTGKLGLYITAVNHQLKKNTDNLTIGLLICKTKDNIEAQYSLESSNLPIGISEYQLSKLLPENFKSSLPSIEEIEERLRDNGNETKKIKNK
ncbi:MAG: PDDEXK nuclease domain-containing protein [Flavobacteriaceae bacterium]|jgi:predicted nuclease of restriction endonuclease-like (RecB) superfamily|nr:PDDEXK nuclease domain-containing protein [Flavobacteriaceae bacterium]